MTDLPGRVWSPEEFPEITADEAVAAVRAGRVYSGPMVAGERAGDRLMRAQYVERAVQATGLTREQVAAVLHGLADHTALMAALDYSKPEDGYWPEATSLGRWLHDTANQLEGR